MKPRKQTRLSLIALVIASALWGSTFLLGKLAFAELAVSQVILYRFASASLVLLPVAIFRRAWPTRHHLPLFLLTGFLTVPVTFLLQFGGLSRTTVSSAALLVGALPLLLALGASWFFGERLSRVGWTAVGLSSLGIVLLVGLPGRGHDWLGDLLVFSSLITTAAWVLLNKRLLRSYSALVATAYILAFGTVMLVPISLWWDGTLPTDLSAGVWLSVLGLGLAGTAFAFTLWNWGLEHWEASRAGVFLNLEPVIGAALGVTILGETLGPGALLGGALVVCSAVVISLPVSSAQPKRTPPPTYRWPAHRPGREGTPTGSWCAVGGSGAARSAALDRPYIDAGVEEQRRGRRS